MPAASAWIALWSAAAGNPGQSGCYVFRTALLWSRRMRRNRNISLRLLNSHSIIMPVFRLRQIVVGRNDFQVGDIRDLAVLHNRRTRPQPAIWASLKPPLSKRVA